MPVTLDVLEKIQDSKQIKSTEITHIKYISATTKANNAKQNYASLVAFYNTRPENEVGLFYNTPEPTWSEKSKGQGLICFVYTAS